MVERYNTLVKKDFDKLTKKELDFVALYALQLALETLENTLKEINMFKKMSLPYLLERRLTAKGVELRAINKELKERGVK